MTTDQTAAAARECHEYCHFTAPTIPSVKSFEEIIAKHAEGVAVIDGRVPEVLPWGDRFRISEKNNPLYKLAKNGVWHREANMDDCLVLDDWTWPTRAAALAFLSSQTKANTPDKPGWWLWTEGDREPVKMLIVCGRNHSEVAGDEALSQALGREIGPDDNYWEGTDTRKMPGTWEFLSSQGGA